MPSVTEALDRLRQEGRHRSLTRAKNLVDFSSNDYLGLSNRPEIRDGLLRFLQDGGVLGSTGSRLLSGNAEEHERLEHLLARRFGVESALLFSAGYLANVGVLSALGDEETEIFSDAGNHASLIDGMRLSKAKRSIFRHNDMADLRNQLASSSARRKIVVTESVFSMDGDLAPIEDLLSLARESDGWLVLDEAHATGVFGKSGLGRLEEIESRDVEIVSIHTCGKALGAQGAFVLSSGNIREYLINFSRPFIYSTAISPIVARQIELAMELLPAMHSDRRRLRELSFSLCESLQGICDTGRSESQIVPVLLGGNEKALRVSQDLRAEGLDVRAIRFPTVPLGSERLRISLKSFHLETDIARLKDALLRAVKQ